MADILVVDCGSIAGTGQVLGLLDGFSVTVLRANGEMQGLSARTKTDAPCAVLCTVSSRQKESRVLVEELLQIAGSKPVLVIDERFDDDYGRSLLDRGALDYLDRDFLDLSKLHRRIDWAVLRNGHRSPRSPSATQESTNDDSRAFQRIYKCLPQRQREILDLLLQRLPTKKIAKRLGISPKTVHSHLANLRCKFGAASSQDLLIVLLRDHDRGLSDATRKSPIV